MLQFKSIRSFKKNKKIILLFSIILIIVYKFFSTETVRSTSTEKSVNKKIQSVLVKRLNSENFNETIVLRGNTQSSRIVIIKAQVEGRVSALFHKKGDFVKAGKQILLIDPEDKIAKSKEMEALLEQRKKEYEVAEKLFKKGFRSEVKLSESRTKFESSLAKFERSQVELSNTNVMIPFDSFLEESYVELGTYLKKGDKVAKIVDLDPIYLVASASEKEIINLKVGQKGLAVLNSGKKVEGYVNYISASADEKTRNFTIQLEIKNPYKNILDGISGEMHIKLKDRRAFFIPSSVVTLDNEGKIGIKTVDKNIVKFEPIKILSDTGKGYWIDASQNENLNLIVMGQEYILENEVINPEYMNE